MKHHKDATPPYYSIAPGVQVVYHRPGQDAEAEAKTRANEVQAIYDKGRAVGRQLAIDELKAWTQDDDTGAPVGCLFATSHKLSEMERGRVDEVVDRDRRQDIRRDLATTSAMYTDASERPLS